MNALSSRLDIDSLGSWGVEWSIISIAGVSWSIDNQYGELRGRGGNSLPLSPDSSSERFSASSSSSSSLPAASLFDNPPHSESSSLSPSSACSSDFVLEGLSSSGWNLASKCRRSNSFASGSDIDDAGALRLPRTAIMSFVVSCGMLK